MPVIAQPEPEKDLYTWQAPSRPFKKRNREFYTTILALVILLSIILMFAKEFLLIAVIMAFGFFAYVLASVEPETISHRLTNRGIRTAGKLYHWNSVSRYWWEDKWGQQLLHLELPGQFPGKLLLLQGQGNQKEIEAILKKYSVEDKPDPTWLDKSAAWLQEKVPLESS
jgi:hypothetical protein